ncbi:T9SS type A sorting domain-containing protein, partial [Candidatus Venteria ishoeyi]|uniref:T9SS type A sorting domain-containing protein n=1 Tax=Candidatus Venteria ishoeyi TaxID=1899563 RepID=UPI0011B0CCEC
NPTSENLYCTNPENSIIQIYSLTGELLFNSLSSKSNININTSSYGEGTYILKVIASKKVFIEKFIILK